MNIRPKTLRRLLILFGVLLAIVGGILALILLSIHKRDAELAALRQQAFAAFEQKDYSHSVGLFSDYLARSHRQDKDPDAVFAYAKSRANTPMDNSRHIFEAAGVLEQYLQQRPDDLEAQHLLLSLYGKVLYNKEAKSLAAKLLARNPNDVEALHAQISALANEHNLSEALAQCQKLNRLAPLDLASQLRELELMNALKTDPAAILAHAQALRTEHPGDSRFEALTAAAYQYAHDPQDMRRAMEAAAHLPPADPDSAVLIATMLDRAGRFDLSADLLERAAAKFNDPRLLRQYVQRLWEQQHDAKAIERSRNVDLTSPDTDPALLGYRALALYDAKQPSEARRVTDALAQRHDDPAQAWAIALQAKYGAPVGAAVLIQRFKDAVGHDARNPVVHAMLADAYAVIGESDQAIREWQTASQLSPAWATPLFHISRTLAATGRYRDALAVADLVRQRAPTSPTGAIAYALAWYGVIAPSATDPNSPNVSGLLKQLAAIQAKVPDEPNTLPDYVSLLARTGQKDKAIEVVKAAIAADPPPPNETFARLSQVSREEHLGLEDQLLDRAEKTQGLTPAIAFARATSLYESGKQKEAIDLLEAQRQSHPKEPSWLLAEARFRDMAHDPGALKNWTDLADANPADLFVQYNALNSPSRVDDRAFWRRTIDRVKGLTGDSGQAWRLEDARWRLSDPGEKDLDSVINSLQQIVRESPGLPDAHRLLAQALMRGNRPDSLDKATVELTAANDLQPGDFETLSQITHLLALQGKHDEAVQMVDSLVKQPHPTRRQRLWAAQTYSDLGYNDAAIKLLTADDNAGGPDPARDALLAALYRRTGRADDARRIYLQILQDPSPDPAALGNAAEFFASRHDTATEQQFLDRLRTMPLRPGAFDVLKAHIEELYGSPGAAKQILELAAAANPGVEQIWQELAGYYLRHNALDQAEATVARGLKTIPASPMLLATREHIGRLRGISGQGLAPLVEVIAHDPLNAVADETLRVLAEAHDRGDSAAQTAATLRTLADRHPQFLPLQELLVQQYVATGQFREAADVASRAGEVSPNSAEPLRLLCAVYSAHGDWASARRAALRWRQKLANPIEADLTIATTYLQQRTPDPNAAIQQLAPYVADASPQPLKEAALPVYCRALIVAGRSADAAALLEPLLSQSPQWRLVWLELSAAWQKDAQAASDWLAKVAPMLQNGSVQERLALAAEWEEIGTRYDSLAALQQARSVIEPLLTKPPIGASAWQLAALVWQSLDELPRSEEAWRQALSLNPNDPKSQNNLAYVLLREGGEQRLAEAQRLASAAVAAAPSVSTFYDTLARIQLQQGNRDAALKSFRTGLEKDPDNLEAMIGLADALQARESDRQEARGLMGRINAALQSANPLPPPVRKQLDRVKSALSATE